MDKPRDNYTVSIHYDRRLYRQDIAGSTVHARMLAKQGIISTSDAAKIVEGLKSIRDEIDKDLFLWRDDLEDIHMNVEQRLFEKIGDVAGRLHTARSRNDQVVLDLRLYVKETIIDILHTIWTLRETIVNLAEAKMGVVIAGYTHLQRAQPVLFAHHMLAYFDMFGRDAQRFKDAYRRTDVMPLGSGAIAGVPYPIDRDFVAKELGFTSVSSNSMDAVSDRDFVLDFHSGASICAMHLSRLAEELVIWSSDEFGLVRISDSYTTGSSMMPQKRNPDFAELARGRAGRIFGHLVALLTTMKGLPLTYNRDLQEDKEGLFDTVDVIVPVLRSMTGMLSTMEVHDTRMNQTTQSGYLLATDIADYLVKKGMAFREAHGVTARLSAFVYQEGITLQDLPLASYQKFSPLFDDGVFEITVDTSLGSRNVYGGTASSRVKKAIATAKATLESENVN